MKKLLSTVILIVTCLLIPATTSQVAASTPTPADGPTDSGPVVRLVFFWTGT
jgi:hypothetical protein